MASYATIVIGASSGGVEALQKLVAGLPDDIPAAIFIVQHIGRHPSRLPELLSNAGPLPARHAGHLEPVEPGTIYVAPPDHHLILVQRRTMLTRGPRENWARPAIDPLFRSAALSAGQSAVGVVLSGALNDGTAGVRLLRAEGGTAVVQDPREAAFPEMPASALRFAGADHCVPLDGIPPLLGQLAKEIVSAPIKEPSDRWRTAP